MAIKSYQPSNGTEGMGFIQIWCATCKHDEDYFGPDPDPEKGCQILARTLAFRPGDPEYPKEWVRCTETFRSWCTAYEKSEKWPRTGDDQTHVAD